MEEINSCFVPWTGLSSSFKVTTKVFGKLLVQSLFSNEKKSTSLINYDEDWQKIKEKASHSSQAMDVNEELRQQMVEERIPRVGAEWRHQSHSSKARKLGKKMDMRKAAVENWKNGVGERIEKKLQRTLEKIGCSKCHERGHYKYTCRNPRADFDDDEPGVVVSADDLFMGNLNGSGPPPNG
ncbi:hypothetical protein Cgig2_028303 [Carnegiea gigantea]|uniref:Uncharacterized protein n=1 Tax=Carnegiea gigantea TaxID=171969 RepID=A0A9Q1JN08_9CARY|nr:hypothetical protein Cgig2_028303 [Carnegiea gigantea]